MAMLLAAATAAYAPAPRARTATSTYVSSAAATDLSVRSLWGCIQPSRASHEHDAMKMRITVENQEPYRMARIDKPTLLRGHLLRGVRSSVLGRSYSSVRCHIVAQEGGRSIGEVVGGLHGSKYQFGAAQQYEGSKFAEALAVSGSGEQQATSVDSDDRPDWVPEFKKSDTIDGSLRFGAPGETCRVQITNMYRAWENYYAEIIICAPNLSNRDATEACLGSEHFVIANRSGVLAPRGGANNVCDPNKPYSDSNWLEVTFIGNQQKGCAQLLIITEERQRWAYELIVD